MILNGRKIRASIAKDNGRAAEFIRKRVYKDKSRCYECGEEGHLSYECPKNVLGPRREWPAPKKGRKGGGGSSEGRGDARYGEERDEQVFEEESWATAVDGWADERLLRVAEDGTGEEGNKEKERRRRGRVTSATRARTTIESECGRIPPAIPRNKRDQNQYLVEAEEEGK